MRKQKYRLSPKAMVWECLVILFAIPVIAAAFGAGMVAAGLERSGKLGFMGFLFSVFFNMGSFVFGAFSLALIIIPIGRVLFSYLALFEGGIEYRLWPLHKIYCTWDGAEEIKKSPLPFQGELLTCNNADVSGFHILLDFNKGEFGLTKTLPVIPLYQFDGWDSGLLKSELSKFAPKLFMNTA